MKVACVLCYTSRRNVKVACVLYYASRHNMKAACGLYYASRRIKIFNKAYVFFLCKTSLKTNK